MDKLAIMDRRERRMLARRGIDVSRLGTVHNRVVPADPHTSYGKLPETAADWQGYLQDNLASEEGLKKEFATGRFQAALTSYAEARNKERTEMLAQMREQTEAQLTEWLKDNQAALPGEGRPKLDFSAEAKAGAAPSPKYNNPRAVGAPLNGVFPDVWTFMQDVHTQRHQPNQLSADARKRLDLYNTYSEKVPSEGGFLVPEEFRSQLLQLSLGSAVVRPRATIIPMGAPRLHIPMVDETSRVSSVYGGIVVYRTEEGGEIPESSASFAAVKLDVTKQTALAHVPNELIRDWGAFGAFMDATLPAAMAFYEDVDYINGPGVGAPLGALNAANTALLVIAARGGQASTTIVWENVLDMYSRMLPSSIGNAVWLASPDAFVQLATMALSVGTGGSAVWLTDAHGTPQLTLLGRPVIMTEKVPGALGSQGDLSFVDWTMYLVGDLQTMTIESSPHVKFTSDKTTFRAIARNDGRPWLQSPITPRNNGATLSPFTTLAARP